MTFTKSGEVELCILSYNDDEVEPYLRLNFPEYINDGRLKVKSMYHELPFTCGRVKNFSHAMGTGKILFNLDADNFICNGHDHALALRPRQILKNTVHDTFGVSGRIAIYKDDFYRIGGYRDVGRHDDGDIVLRAVKDGMCLLSMRCDILPISNEYEE